MFSPSFTSSNLLKASQHRHYRTFTFFGLTFADSSCLTLLYPLSLAATYGVAFAFLSSRY